MWPSAHLSPFPHFLLLSYSLSSAILALSPRSGAGASSRNVDFTAARDFSCPRPTTPASPYFSSSDRHMDGPHASTQHRNYHLRSFSGSLCSLISSPFSLSLSFPNPHRRSGDAQGDEPAPRRAVALERLGRRAATLGELPGELRPERAARPASRRPRGAPRRAAACESGSAGEPPPSGTPRRAMAGFSWRADDAAGSGGATELHGDPPSRRPVRMIFF
jgi:hypothetical protein